MRTFEYPRTISIPSGIQAVFVVLCGLALSWLAINVSTPVLFAALVTLGYCTMFLLRPELGLLVILAVRPSTDVGMTLMGLAISVGPLAFLTPSAGLLLILMGCGAAYMLARGVPFISLPGGAALILFQLVGVVAMLHAEGILPSLMSWVAVASSVIVYALAAHLFRTSRQIQRVIDVVAISFVTPAIFGLQQLAQGVSRVAGTFVSAPGFSQYLVLILIVSTGQFLVHSGRRKFLAMVIMATSGVLLIATGTRGSWAGAAAGLLVIAILRKRVLMMLVLIALMFAAPMIPSINARLGDLSENQHSSFADRLDLWQSTIQEWTTLTDTGSSIATIVNRVVGLGPRSQQLVTQRAAYGEMQAAHNDYLRVALEYGIFGLVLYLSFTLAVTVFAYRTWRRCTDKRLGAVVMSFVALTIGYSIVSFGENVFAAAYVQIPLWTLAGLTVAIAKLRTPLETQRLPGQ